MSELFLRAPPSMRLITLNGAPQRRHLDFSEHILLQLDQSIPPAAAQIRWRRLGPRNPRLQVHAACSSREPPESPTIHYDAVPHLLHLCAVCADCPPSSSKLASDHSCEDRTPKIFQDGSIDAQAFPEPSHATHATLLSSQIAPISSCNHPGDADQPVSSSSFLTSFGTTTTRSSHSFQVCGPNRVLHPASELVVTSLAELPDAAYLRSITPQTLTSTLVCVLIARMGVRQVVVSRGNYLMNISEIAVADDTSPAFKMAFWSRPPQAGLHGQDASLSVLDSVRIGDILLLQNVALTFFRDRVHGQSVYPRIGHARTTVEVLVRHDGSAGSDRVLPASIASKVLRVETWAKNHVANENVNKTRQDDETCERGKSDARSHDEFDKTLPPDTMEAR